jgi:hydroxyacylglutathione hydrolase
LNIKQFRYGTDNLGYLVYAQKNALVIDGGAHQEISVFVEHHHLDLLYIANTHSHHDHTLGNRFLLKRPNIALLRSDELIRQGTIVIENQKIEIIRTPGHTEDSVCFYTGNALITGDTLFNGTIGNCFTGNLKNFYNTIKCLMKFPQATFVYAGHDYVHDAMQFAGNLEPDNKQIDIYLAKYKPDHVYSSLSDEFQINPYMRFNTGNMIDVLKNRGLPWKTEWERWQSVMSIE